MLCALEELERKVEKAGKVLVASEVLGKAVIGKGGLGVYKAQWSPITGKLCSL